MNIQKIHIVDFKCVEDLTIDFETIRGFWEIEGAVGSGKTTIGESILFGLFGTVRGKNNADFIRWGQKRSFIELWLQSRGHSIYIKRTINLHGQSPLEAKVDDVDIIFTDKRDAQRQLENEYFDVSRLMIESLCIISFNGFKSLSSMNSKDTKEFLDQAFGFKIITEYADVCAELKKDVLRELNKCMTDCDATNRSIKQVEEWIKHDEHITPQMLTEVETLIKTLESQYQDVKTKFKTSRVELDAEYTKIKSEQATIKAQGVNIKKNIDFISKGICPTCGAPLDQSHLKEHQNEREILLEKYKSVSAKAEEIAGKILKLDSQRDAELEPIGENITKQNVKYNHFKDQLNQQKLHNQAIDDLNERLKQFTKRQSEIEGDVEQWNELFNIISKDVKDNILESLIPAINNKISQYIIELGLPYIVNFDSTFACHVEVTSVDKDVSLNCLSTGQLKTVDMIIILAILNVLLSNISFNIVFLDELLSNMDEELRDTMCALLKRSLSADKNIFVISHAKLNDSYIDGRIHVSYSNHLAEYHINNL